MGVITVTAGEHFADLLVTGAVSQASTSSFATVTGADIDARPWKTVSYTIVVTDHDVDWQVLGANASDYSDAVVVQASAKITAGGAAGSFTASPAPFSFYRVQIKDDVGGTHGTPNVNGCAKG